MTSGELTAPISASSHASHAERGMSRGMAGMVLFIASEVMLFGGLFAGYFFVRNQAEVWPPEGVHELDWQLGAILTAILVISGLVGHTGIVALRKGNNQLFVLLMAATILLGLVFIGGQAYEWLELMDEGLVAGSTVYGSTFYVLTGFHGAHVIAGLLMLIVVFLRAYWRDFTPARHVFADSAMLYWHFVDIVWVGLYLLLYLS
jgi:cytochrome c oxidase subunit 3